MYPSCSKYYETMLTGHSQAHVCGHCMGKRLPGIMLHRALTVPDHVRKLEGEPQHVQRRLGQLIMWFSCMQEETVRRMPDPEKSTWWYSTIDRVLVGSRRCRGVGCSTARGVACLLSMGSSLLIPYGRPCPTADYIGFVWLTCPQVHRNDESEVKHVVLRCCLG
jgi:hypothetical protein